MSKKVQATILKAPPVSGSGDEVRFDATGDCTWVQFTDEETQQHWYGVFGDGDPRGAKTVTTNTNGQAFVIAGGQGYLIDIPTRKLLHKTAIDDYLESVIAVPGKDLFLAGDIKLYAYSSTGLLWQSPRVAVDGITFTGATASQVKGLVEALDGKVLFTLRLSDWDYQSEFVLPEAMRII